VIWLIVTGEWPPGEIDHCDTDGTNNAWRNLRPATPSQQKMNRKIQSNNTSGYKGVSKHGTNWRAQIWSNRKRVGLGSFPTREQAYAAYCQANQDMHGDFSRIV
jgi:hypothetical protein